MTSGSRVVLGIAAGFALLGCDTLTHPDSGPGTMVVAGRVVDLETGAPIEGASISVSTGAQGTITDSLGRFTIQAEVPADYAVLLVRRIGYSNVELPVGDDGDGEAWLGDVPLRSSVVACSLTTILVCDELPAAPADTAENEQVQMEIDSLGRPYWVVCRPAF